jgi:hypothetical protein
MRNVAPLAVVLMMVACGSSGGSGHPDTGYGANQPVPATVNCVDFCTRAADCGTQLCNEDKMTTSYTALAPAAAAGCESACDSTVLAQFTPTIWQCYFQSSCRALAEQNVCHVSPAGYTCN